MHAVSLHQLVGNTDIYLLDQILKMRYAPGDCILDAGCGQGRNLHWFMTNQMDVYGIDHNEENIDFLRALYPTPANRFYTNSVEQMPFQDAFFNHIISSAVLHFAKDSNHFYAMFSEMLRVLQPGGTLFIRMTSSIGIEPWVMKVGKGNFELPDGSTRFLIDRQMISDILVNYQLTLLEPVKTVNVADSRCMTTLVLMKQQV